MTEITYTVPDMSCDHCEVAVSSEPRNVPGFRARPARAADQAAAPSGSGGSHHRDEPFRVVTRRLAVAVVLTVPVALLAMAPPLRFADWQWLALVLSTPVVFYSGIGFHRAAV